MYVLDELSFKYRTRLIAVPYFINPQKEQGLSRFFSIFTVVSLKSEEHFPKPIFSKLIIHPKYFAYVKAFFERQTQEVKLVIYMTNIDSEGFENKMNYCSVYS